MTKFKILKDEIVYDGRFVRVAKRYYKNKETGKIDVWEMVKRRTHGKIVGIIALTPKNEVILTKIFRIPFKAWIVEACAGLADQKHENAETLARRELLEETGYTVKSVTRLATGPFNAGLLNDEILYFLGTGAKKIREPQLEESEDIQVLKIPLQKLDTFLLHPPKNVKVDIKLLGMVYLLKMRNV